MKTPLWQSRKGVFGMTGMSHNRGTIPQRTPLRTFSDYPIGNRFGIRTNGNRKTIVCDIHFQYHFLYKEGQPNVNAIIAHFVHPFSLQMHELIIFAIKIQNNSLQTKEFIFEYHILLKIRIFVVRTRWNPETTFHHQAHRQSLCFSIL